MWPHQCKRDGKVCHKSSLLCRFIHIPCSWVGFEGDGVEKVYGNFFYFLIFKSQVDKNNKMDPIKSHGVHDTET